MKKYQQLGLLVIVLFSIFGLLTYRKEYVELRSTFESFNIFGDQGKPPTCMVFNGTVDADLLKSFDPSYSGWTKLSNDFFVYSAYSINNGVSIAVGIGPKGVVPEYECHIWHEYKDTLFSSRGNFNYQTNKVSQSTYDVFQFTCVVDSSKIPSVPYMFIFVNNYDKYFIPIVRNNKFSGGNRATICVYPDYVGINQVSIIEFISFHIDLGFTDFHIYDELHFGLLFKVKNIVRALNLTTSFNVLRWNYPLSKDDPSSKIVLDADCHYRNGEGLSLVATLNYYDYIVPKYMKNVMEISTNIPDSAFIDFNYQTCCTNFKDDRKVDKSWPTIFKKNNCLTNINESRRVIVHPNNGTSKRISANTIASVHTYKPCAEKELSKLTYEPSTQKFLRKMLRNKIVLLWNSGYFF